MSFTNSTPNYGLPQWIGTDKPTYLGDQNTAYSTIDTQMKANADAAAAATSTANTAASTATTASTNATTALNTANSAASEAAAATSAAASATSTANNAATDAATALRASAANSIENLAPAYDPTLTYAVGDLVTYIDEQNSGKLYKCIVAIGTPEAFNINKWDDVTTSEVYSKKSKLVNTVTTDGVKTYTEILNELFTSIDTTKEYLLTLTESGQVSVLHSRRVTATVIELTQVVISTSACSNDQVIIGETGSTWYRWTANTTGNTFTDRSSSPMSNGITLNLYELATI